MRVNLVTEYLEETARKFPDKPAFVGEEESLTFSELRNSALRIAHTLHRQNVIKKPVAILMDKSVKCIAAFFGTVYSGNFYTPIDSSMPSSRIEKILDTLQPAIIITSEECELAQSDLINKYKVLFYEKMVQEDRVDEAAVLSISHRMIDTDILYVLFTSGSTGVPKGVIISHRSVIDFVEEVVEVFDIDSGDSFGNQAPFYFDLSILDVFCTIKTGSTNYLIPEKFFSFPILLLQYLEENAISIFCWAPSALCLVANSNELGKVPLKNLKKILFIGETMPNKQLNMWREAYPEPLYANLYGPTEITHACTYYIVDREFKDSDSLPIGHPFRNTDILVLNDDNELVERGEIGELCVRGSSLAMGYYNNPEKTGEVFVQNPLNDSYPEMIYRTGDLVKYNEQGELLFLSRKDFQIKHRGYRIELGEIETAAGSIKDVESCCCLYDDTRKKIVLFYTAGSELPDIKRQLKEILPHYMIPGKIKRLDEIPLNINGKIDRNQLKRMLSK